MSVLDDDDLAFLRETQTEVRPTPAVLFAPTTVTKDALGGATSGMTTADNGQPIQVRITTMNTRAAGPDSEAVELASRYGMANLRKVRADLVTILSGSLLHDLDRDRWYEVVSTPEVQEWTTAALAYVVGTDRRPPP